MTISFACPKCARKFQVKDELAGRRSKCPTCGESITIPAADSAPATEGATGAAREPAAPPLTPIPLNGPSPDVTGPPPVPPAPIPVPAEDAEASPPDAEVSSVASFVGASSITMPLLIGGILAAILLVAGGVWIFGSGNHPPAEAEQIAQGAGEDTLAERRNELDPRRRGQGKGPRGGSNSETPPNQGDGDFKPSDGTGHTNPSGRTGMSDEPDLRLIADVAPEPIPEFAAVAKEVSLDGFYAVPEDDSSEPILVAAGRCAALAIRAKDPQIRTAAQLAAEAWALVPPAYLTVEPGRDADLLTFLAVKSINQMAEDAQFKSINYRLEVKQRNIWSEYLVPAANRAYASVREQTEIIVPEVGVASTPLGSAAGLSAENTAGTDLHDVAIDLELVSAWGGSMHFYYFFPEWRSGEDKSLFVGVAWGRKGLLQTSAANLTVWSRELCSGISGSATPQFQWPEHLQRIMQQAIAQGRKELGSGNYEAALELANRVSQAAVGHSVILTAARELEADARAMKSKHQAALAVVKPGSNFEGRWAFGYHQAPLGLRFVEMPDERYLRRYSVAAQLYDPDSPTMLFDLVGAIRFVPSEGTYAIVLSANGLSGTGLNGLERQLHPDTKNFFVKGNDRTYVLSVNEGDLRGKTDKEETIELLPRQQPDFAQRLEQLTASTLPGPPLEDLGAIPPFPAEVLYATAEPREFPFEHAVGELGRVFGRKPGYQSQSNNRISNVFIHPSRPMVYALQSSGHTRAWDLTRNQAAPIGEYCQGMHMAAGGKFLSLLLRSSNEVRPTLIDAADGSKLGEAPYHSALVAISPDGSKLAAGHRYGKEMFVATTKGGKVLLQETFADTITGLAFSPDGRYVLSGSKNKVLLVWDLESGKAVQTYTAHRWGPTQMIVSPDGKWVFSVAPNSGLTSAPPHPDLEFHIWELATGRKVYEHTLKEAWFVALSPDWRKLLTGSRKIHAGLYNTASGKETYRLEGHTRPVSAAAFTADNRFVVTGGNDDWIIMWGLPEG